MADKPSAIRGARIVGERYARAKRQENPDGRMPLFDHLRELRNRVVKIAVAVLVGAGVSWAFYQPIWDFIQRPYCRAVTYCKPYTLGHTLILNGVMDGFYLHVKVAVIAGAILTSPFWLYQLWAFVAPGLYSREKRWTYAFLGTAVPLFGLGCFFAFIAMSRGLDFFIGLCFEVPLFLVILNLARVVTHERFRKWRRLIIFLVFVFAGIASPSPDPLTMLLLGGVVVALVEIAEVLIYLNDKRWARNHPELTDADIDNYEPAPVEASERIDADTSL
jgi:sec-independent protein translocase protein TatC